MADAVDKLTSSNGLGYILYGLKLTLGIVNIWRFPYICYQYGGGSFFIPYTIVLAFIGLPMFYMEFAMGQYSEETAIFLFHKLAPGLVGIGFAQIICTIIIASYLLHAYAIYAVLFFASFTTNLAWVTCDVNWKDCVGRSENRTDGGISSAQMYLDKTVLSTRQIDEGLGIPDWYQCAFVAALWLSVSISILRRCGGIISIILLLATVMLFVALLLVTIDQVGAVDGIMYMLVPEWPKMFSPCVWLNAVAQCFLSLNIGTGAVSLYGAAGRVHNNILMISLITVFSNYIFSTLCGLLVFADLGNMAYRFGTDIEDVYNGDSMIFSYIFYMDAMSNVPSETYLFSIFFNFFIIFFATNAIAYLVAVVSNNIVGFTGMKFWQAGLLVALMGTLTSIIYTTPGGFAVTRLIDAIPGTNGVIVLATIELIAICYVYGLNRWCWNLEYMVGSGVSIFWRFSWGFLIPAFIITVLISCAICSNPLTYLNHHFPVEAIVPAFAFMMGICVPTFIVAIIYYMNYRNQMKLNMEAIYPFSPQNWLPNNPDHMADAEEFSANRSRANRFNNRPQFVQYSRAIFRHP